MIFNKSLFLNSLNATLIVILFSIIPAQASPTKTNLNHPLFIEIVGIVAGFGTTFAALPDCLTMVKNRSTQGMNPRMAAITGLFQILWLVYGLLIDAPAVIFWNIIAILTNGITVAAYVYFYQLESKK